MDKLLEASIKQLTKHLEKGNITENEIALSKILDELSQLEKENQKLNDSINQSNLAKISALMNAEQLQQENDRLNKLLRQLVDEETDWQVNNGQVKLEKLQQEKEELIKWLKTEYMCFDNESDECIIARQILSKLKESDK